MKRKLKWLAAVLVVLLLGFGTALFLWPRDHDRITVESWKKIRIGMTEDEVAEILGGPGMSGEEAQRLEKELARIGKPPIQFSEEIQQEPEVGLPFIKERSKVWLGHRGALIIEFDGNPEGRVRRKMFCEIQSSEVTFLDRLRDWLGW